MRDNDRVGAFTDRAVETDMLTFIAWCVLLVFSWPLALLALLLWPIVWVITLPLRIAGFAVEGALGLLRGLFMLPARILGARS